MITDVLVLVRRSAFCIRHTILTGYTYTICFINWVIPLRWQWVRRTPDVLMLAQRSILTHWDADVLLINGDYDTENAILADTLHLPPSYRVHLHTWWKQGAVFGISDSLATPLQSCSDCFCPFGVWERVEVADTDCNVTGTLHYLLWYLINPVIMQVS